MAFKLGIKGKTLEQCSFNERFVLALVDVHGATLRGDLMSIAAAGDIMVSTMSTNRSDSATDQMANYDLRTEAANKAGPLVCKSAFKFAARYFPEYDIEIEYVPDEDKVASHDNQA